MSHLQQEKEFKVPAIPSAEDEANCKEGTGDSEDAHLEKIRRSLAVFMVVGGLPFEMVEGNYFIELMSLVNPKLELPSSLNLSKYCYQMYLDEKLKLQKFMETNCQSVCLTTDTWTSVQELTYLGITAHFIDEDWKLHRKILYFLGNPLCSGEEISTEIETCLLEWRINKVFTVTMDKASSNDNAIVHLKEKLIERGNGFLDCKYLQMKCIAEIINSVAVEALEDASLLVNRVRSAVRYVKFNPEKLKKFKKCVEDEKIESMDRLYLDVSDVWNTTYVMLCRAEKYEKAFDRYEKLDANFKLAIEDGPLSSVDWFVVRKLTVVLRPFYNIMVNISSSSNVTSNNFWVDISDLYATFLEWKNGNDLKLQNVANKMKLKLDEYLGGYEKMNKIVYIASILDPRSKLEVLEFAFGQIYGEEKGSVLFKDVKEALFEMFNEYKKMLQLQLKVVEKSNSASNEDIVYKNFFMVSYKKRKLDKKSELESYLDEPTQDDNDDFDILEWWKCNSGKFPVLACMARDILAIPKSTVRPDIAFNTGGGVIDEHRGEMEFEILQGLVCAQDWLRLGLPKSQMDIVKEHDEDEMYDEGLISEFGELGSSWGGGSDSD
ncbi:zinc finger BED domain-containing protein DAYSLEEPER-like isoform X2 [Euphorbia lathyris]|uniref:zinc finger BED domain-containing protein DAYSLEEPER-like isoform X2 n=1 Tax=Euphorbia lathyris TaxID=212925 RepID=UPI003313C111